MKSKTKNLVFGIIAIVAVLAITLILVFNKSSPQTQKLAGSSEMPLVYTVVDDSSAMGLYKTTLNCPVKIISNNESDADVGARIYAHNATHIFNELVIRFNGTYNYSATRTWTDLDGIVLNKTPRGTVTVYENCSGLLVANITGGNTTAYNRKSYDGATYIVPGLINSTVLDVSRVKEYVLYTGCDSVNTSTLNVSFTYYVSPDASKWYSGSALVGCNNTQNAISIADKGVMYIKIGVNQTSPYANKVYAKLAYKE